MDMLDPGLDPAASATAAAAAASHDKGPEAEEGVELQEGGDGPGAEEQTAVAIASVQQAAFGDHNIQYQFRTENNGGQVTYRVVQVTDGQLDGQGDTAGAVSVVSTAAFAGGQQAVTQVGVDGATQRPGPAAASVPPGPAAPFPLAVIQNPFSNGGSPAAEAVSGEARFAYFPASSVGDTTAVSVQTTDQSLQAGGQFYVMMTPQDVLQTGTQRTIAPRTHPYSPKIDGTRTPRDERRRAQHNEGGESPGHRGSAVNVASFLLFLLQWSGGGGTRSTTGSSSFQKSFQIVMQIIARQERVKEGSCRRPATTSGSCARPTSACRRPSRRPSGCRWTVSS
ncbi:upstream stimulatory factor 2 isoform X2 [Sagmatias obliquidens]|uniref:upstream stimulatory factor 2 isoform X2 n=1 Tax=Sagmatias obliquidens TaxID=3371155 RepID=UPI000F4455F9|nr:upstream stimulatory factor 2 isoform X2 [Lagenorhynchus obliquidens]XP_030730611.1 upstream stimulatory factor 2 isoform X2 [Globicephala melas]